MLVVCWISFQQGDLDAKIGVASWFIKWTTVAHASYQNVKGNEACACKAWTISIMYVLTLSNVMLLVYGAKGGDGLFHVVWGRL